MNKCVLSRVHFGKGFYILLLSTLLIYLVLTVLRNGDEFLKKFLSIYILIVDVLIILISTIFLNILSKTGIEVEFRNRIESVENIETPIKIFFKFKQISKFFKITKIEIGSDKGLWITRWSQNNNYVIVNIVGYPGAHKIYSYRVEISTLFSIYKALTIIILDTPVEILIAPSKHASRFNVETVLPYFQIFEGRASRRKGVSSEVMSVREFVPGDEYKKIHWKATARTKKLMVKEYEHRIYRTAVIIAFIHREFFIGEPPPIVFLIKILIDIAETLLLKGMKIVLGIVTEVDIKISTLIDITKTHNIYKILSEIEWPIDVIKYTTSNKLLKWFIRSILETFCRELCIVFLMVDPLDDIDIENLIDIYKLLNQQKHVVKVLLASPSAIRFLYSDKIELKDVDAVKREIIRLKKTISRLKTEDVYLPSAYLRVK